MLDKKSRQSKKLFLIAFIGPVGSGKTRVAKTLARKLGARHVQTDALRVKLRRAGKPISRAVALARKMQEEGLRAGRSVLADFDAVLPRSQGKLRSLAKRFGARFFLIHVRTSEKLILERLKKKVWTRDDLFKDSQEAIQVYFIRKKWHAGRLKTQADFVINNTKPLAGQIARLVAKLKGL